MAFNTYLNLKFVDALYELRTTPFTSAEFYAATRTQKFETLAFVARSFRQDHVTNARSLENYLIRHRDVNAWKVGVFKFFHEYYKTNPDSLTHLSLKNDASSMERFIDGIAMNPDLADFYRECGHDPHLALKYSVSKVICDERRLGWMNLFCGKFQSLLDLDDDTGIIAQDLVDQINFVDAAFDLGIVSRPEYEELINKTGERIVRMFSGWGRFLAGILLSRLYTYCISTAEVRYLPGQAQEIIDNFYLACNNDLSHRLPVPTWEHDDLSLLRDALRPFVVADKLDAIWNGLSPRSRDSIARITRGFDIYTRCILPRIEHTGIILWFREFCKFDEFIPISCGYDFRVYYDSLKLPLEQQEFPVFIMKFNMFTNRGVWNFHPYNGITFRPWPENLTVSSGLPVNRGLGNVILPVYIREIGCDIEFQLPYMYKCDSLFVEKSPEEQFEIIKKDVTALIEIFADLPQIFREYNQERAGASRG
ncbi:DUF1266 domain-containing protein [Succinimonas sp.]|uniref:DUF1266 domain-containing protein n=1 Tax=Succinimonas sp. TaxID=1936151 RepID=UPI00386D6093